MNAQTRLNTLIQMAIVSVIAGCGGGGGSDATTVVDGGGDTALLEGRFIDAPVAGLEYASGAHEGVTDADGTFRYAAGQPVMFSVGGVVLGAADGAPVLTPSDLVPQGGPSDPAVQNRVRLLMLMDADGDPANGIHIPDTVRMAARQWDLVDFTRADFDTMVGHMSRGMGPMGHGRALPSHAAATAHLLDTEYCLAGGAYEGHYMGGRGAGDWLMVVDPLTGAITGHGAAADGTAFRVGGTLGEDGTQRLSFRLPGGAMMVATGVPDTMHGPWGPGALSGPGFDGAFTEAGAPAAEPGQYHGTFSGPGLGEMLLDVTATGEVRGTLYHAGSGMTEAVLGVMEVGGLQFQADSGATFTGHIQAGGGVAGEWMGAGGGTGEFAACVAP